MDVQVLLSTMNQNDVRKLVKSMHIESAIVINQITNKKITEKQIKEDNLVSVDIRERGLSKSRNLAIKTSNSDICILADDDMYYVNEYSSIVARAYKQYPRADIIAFYVDNEEKKHKKKKLKEGRVRLLNTMKISSCNISFRRKTIINSDLFFDENFGTGTKKYMGEENIFLFSAIKKGLKIYFVPIKIATLKKSKSTWFNGYNLEYLRVKGAVFYRMSSWMSPLLILQFSIRKNKLFSGMTPFFTLKIMLQGAYQELKK